MKNWMIAVDGAAVNIDHVARVRAEPSAVEGGGWVVRAELDERRWSILANELESRGAALTWIAERFGGGVVDLDLPSALDLVDGPLKANGTRSW